MKNPKFSVAASSTKNPKITFSRFTRAPFPSGSLPGGPGGRAGRTKPHPGSSAWRAATGGATTMYPRRRRTTVSPCSSARWGPSSPATASRVAGRGGMGVVYRATQLALDRTVALKVIAPELLEDDSTARAASCASRKVAASIDHPNVIPIYYAGEEDGVAYIAMRYVGGRRPAQPRSPRGPARAATRARAGSSRRSAQALDAAHAAGLVHRDVKPANVLLGRRRSTST